MLVVSVVGTSFTRRELSKARTLEFLGRSTVDLWYNQLETLLPRIIMNMV
jgi:hypothetical protein